MRITNLLPVSFVYIQGLSFLNPIYLIFLLLLVKKCSTPIFKSRQLLILIALLICQFLAILRTPHELPISSIATLLGLFAFTIRPDLLFGWNGTDDMRQSYRRTITWVILIYLTDSLLRIQYLQFNWVGWSDYELKQWVKNSSWLADDTNTLGIRVIMLYFIARSVGLLTLRPLILKGLFLYLALTCYSRAALGVLLLIFVSELVMENKYKKIFLLPLLFFVVAFTVNETLKIWDNVNFDSSVISKMDLIVGSYHYWLSSGWWERWFGLGYYSNVDVGIDSWASGHSVFYYALVEFGVLGTMLLGALIFCFVRTSHARWVLMLYLLLGLAVFRFDFLFLYIALFFVEHVNNLSKNHLPTMQHPVKN